MSAVQATGLVNALTVDVEEYFHPNAMDATVSPADWDRLPRRVEANTHRVREWVKERLAADRAPAARRTEPL